MGRFWDMHFLPDPLFCFASREYVQVALLEIRGVSLVDIFKCDGRKKHVEFLFSLLWLISLPLTRHWEDV